MTTRRYLLITICVAAPLFLLAGCNARGSASGGAGGGKLGVCASFYTMYDFCEKIGGDRINLFCLMPSGVEPHDWEPAPSDMIALGGADVFVCHGGMEFWADQVLAAVANKDMTVVTVSEASVPEGLGGDPHTWLDPMLAKRELGEIAAAFAMADPENEEFYRANSMLWAEECDKLDQAYKDGLAGAEGMEIVVSHEAFGYLCAAYGLTQVALGGLAPDSEPSAGRVAHVIDLIKSKGITTIFSEELSSPKVIGQIAESTGAETAVLDPIEGLTAEGGQNGDDYFSIMYRNLAALRKIIVSGENGG